MNRHTRRALKKKQKKSGLTKLTDADQKLSAALQALQQIQGLEGVAKTLEAIQEDLQGAHALMTALVCDMEGLNSEMAELRLRQQQQYDHLHRLLLQVMPGAEMLTESSKGNGGT
jgi:chromosome segregation ATPase